MPLPSVDLTTLNNLTPNLDVGDVADPALRLAAFQYIYAELAAIVAEVNSLPTANIQNLAVTTAKINDLAVTTGKIADLAVTTAKLNDLSVTLQKMASGSVGTAQLVDVSVTLAKLAADAKNAANHTYSGEVPGKTNTKDAIDETYTRLISAIGSSSISEVVDARTNTQRSKTYANLKTRLDEETAISKWFYSLDTKKRHFAHRGAMGIAPENTTPAYEKAGQMGFWGFETDVAITSDSEFVLMHDDTVDRTTDGTGNVTSLTLSQIKALTIDGGNNVAAYPGTKVPTLREFLTVCVKYHAVPHLHLKGTYTQANCANMLSILDEFNLRDKCVIVEYTPATLHQFYEIDPRVVLGFLYGDITQANIDNVKTYPNAFYYAEKQYLTTEKIQMVKESGLKLCVATPYQTDFVNYPLSDMDFIVTDNILEGAL